MTARKVANEAAKYLAFLKARQRLAMDFFWIMLV